MKKANRILLTVVLALVVGAIAAAGCGGGGGGGAESGNRQLTLGVATGWDENFVISNLTKQLLEEELGYEQVTLEELELGLVFEGVANGDLAAFQDMWLPNHQAQLDAVEGRVVQLDPWYQGETEFGIGVPYYMDITTIPELNDTDVREILGIEPGAVISEKIPESCIPTYDLEQEYVESSTPSMLSEVDSRYSNGENFAFTPWRPHWMNAEYDFYFLEDPEDCLEELNDGATISTVVNEDLPEDDPVAYAFMQEITLTEDQVNEIENINPNDYGDAVRTWLEDEQNREAMQPAVDAARAAQES